MYALDVKNLIKRYKNVTVVNGITFSVEKGEIFGFLGPNGAGKTTTIKMIIGEKKPDIGEITILGKQFSTNSAFLKNKIGVIPDYQNLYDRLTVNQNLEIFSDLYGINHTKIKELLSVLDLVEHQNKACINLSRGLRQRVLIARAMLHEPELIFLDEPTSALDPHSALLIRNLILKLKKQGTTIFLTTHYMEEADSLCDRIAIMNRGNIIALDTPRNLKLKHGSSTISLETSTDSFELTLGSEETANIISEHIKNDTVVKMHTQEATLEKVFMTITGDKWHEER